MKNAEEFGFEPVFAKINFSKVMNRVQKVIQTVAPHDSAERYRSLGVDCIQGEAKIISPYEIECNGKTITTRNIVVATGSSPLIPPIPGLMQFSYLK